MGAIELRPVALVDGDLVRARVEDRVLTGGGRIPLAAEVFRCVGRDRAIAIAIPLDRLRQDDRLDAVQGVIGDGGHLEHVLGGGVDQRVVGIELSVDDGPAPGIAQQREDALGRLATVDEDAVIVVGELYVLRFTEALQCVSAVLGTHVGVAGCAP